MFFPYFFEGFLFSAWKTVILFHFLLHVKYTIFIFVCLLQNAVSTTRQEERLRDQCLLEAKLFRAIPIALAAGLATHSAIKLGYLMVNLKAELIILDFLEYLSFKYIQRHPSLGSLPKVFAAAVSGYWIGIFSYENKYNRRIYALRYSRYHDDKMVQKKLKDEMFDRYDSTYNIPFPIVDSEYRQVIYFRIRNSANIARISNCMID